MVDVGCAGILVADIICGPIDALPDEGQLLALDALPATAGGCAANVAVNLVKQGVTADTSGRLGHDPAAQVILGELTKMGVGTQHIRYSDTQPTSQTVVLLIRGQDRRYLHVFGANKEYAVSHIDRDWLETLKVFYFGGLFILPAIDMDELGDLLQFCRARGVTTVLDVVIPTDQPGMNGLDRVLPHVDYFVPNNDEARLLTGLSDPLDQARALRGYGARTVIVTRGKDGTLALSGRDLWTTDAFQMATIDPSGGGDAFSAGVIHGMLKGWDMPRMLSYGGALGASATVGFGTTSGVFSAAEAEAFLRTHALNVSHQELE